MDGQSVKTTERGGARGFDAHKRVKGRKRHILVDKADAGHQSRKLARTLKQDQGWQLRIVKRQDPGKHHRR